MDSGAFLEALEAQEFQPVGVVLAGKELGGTFPHPLGVLAAQEATMVEEEAQQIQIAVAWDAEKLEISGAQFLPDFVPIYLGFKCL